MTDFAALASVPLRSESELRMVEIVMLKWKCPEEARSAVNIIRYTDWPFTLTVYDNRANTPNTARAWNSLIRRSACDYVCVIDSDAFVQKYKPCWLTRMMETFDLHDDCRLVLPVTNRCSTPAQKALGDQKYPSMERHDGEWSGFCFLMRKTLLEEVGPFDEEFCGYGQDSEFSIRMARKGGGAYIRRDVWIDHIHGASFKAAAREGYAAIADRVYAQKLFVEKTACA